MNDDGGIIQVRLFLLAAVALGLGIRWGWRGGAARGLPPAGLDAQVAVGPGGRPVRGRGVLVPLAAQRLIDTRRSNTVSQPRRRAILLEDVKHCHTQPPRKRHWRGAHRAARRRHRAPFQPGEDHPVWLVCLWQLNRRTRTMDLLIVMPHRGPGFIGPPRGSGWQSWSPSRWTCWFVPPPRNSRRRGEMPAAN